jgi:hypothetical protein
MKNSSEIAIDKEGVWYYQGQEMIRKDIVQYFSQHLKLDDSGRYVILIGNDQEYVQVEDSPLVVRNLGRVPAEDSGEDKIELYLSDGSWENLDPETLRISDEHIPYCRVRQNTINARFSRAAYYALSQFINEDEEGNFFLVLNGRRYHLRQDQTS